MKDDIGDIIGSSLLIMLFGAFFSLPIGIVTYMVMDNADIHFVKKCVQAGATYENCYKVVNPPRETSK